MKTPPIFEAEIERLFHAERWKVRTIATHLYVHHDVVRRVLGTLPARIHRRRSNLERPLPPRLDPYMALSLAQNPVRLKTELDYALPKSGRVSIQVLHVNGRLVREVVDGMQDAGHYTVSLDFSQGGRLAVSGPSTGEFHDRPPPTVRLTQWQDG